MDQKHFPAQAHVAHPVGEFGPLVQAETFQIFVPVRVEGPGMLAGGEKELLAAAHDRFLQGGEQHMPSSGVLTVSNPWYLRVLQHRMLLPA